MSLIPRPAPARSGTLHPMTLLREHIVAFFEGMGYDWTDGPEVESEWLNFDVLNMARDHFARAADHACYLADPARPGERSGLVLRGHTSPVQARAMLGGVPPLYKVSVGRAFRPDPMDATHSPVFNQLEGLAVDRGLAMTDLKRTLDRFAEAMFGPGIATRLRPHWFAYAEPGAEIDLRCWVCEGRGRNCHTCGGDGWIEWGGCGMVHPKVLANCGIDPSACGAFAFGVGVERTLMLREGLSDLRVIVDGDLRFAQTTRGSPPPALRAAGMHAVGRALVGLGCTEITAFPFVPIDTARRFGFDADDPRARPLMLTHPLPGQAPALRTSLLPGLLDTLRRNAARGWPEADVVEQGHVFLPRTGTPEGREPGFGGCPGPEALRRVDAMLPAQPLHLAAVSTRAGEGSRSIERAAAALHRAGWAVDAVPVERAPWLAGHCMALRVGERTVGHAGPLRPELTAAYQLPPGSCALEIDLEALPVPVPSIDSPAPASSTPPCSTTTRNLACDPT